MPTHLRQSLFFSRVPKISIAFLVLAASLLLGAGLPSSAARLACGQASASGASNQEQKNLPSLELGKPIEQDLQEGKRTPTESRSLRASICT